MPYRSSVRLWCTCVHGIVFVVRFFFPAYWLFHACLFPQTGRNAANYRGKVSVPSLVKSIALTAVHSTKLVKFKNSPWVSTEYIRWCSIIRAWKWVQKREMLCKRCVCERGVKVSRLETLVVRNSGNNFSFFFVPPGGCCWLLLWWRLSFLKFFVSSLSFRNASA